MLNLMLAGEGPYFLSLLRHLARDPGVMVSGIVSDRPVRLHSSYALEPHIMSTKEFLSDSSVMAEWLVCVGYERILPTEILCRFEGRVLNLHNGPLPSYAGRHVTQWAIRNGEACFGSSIHFVTPTVDAGDIVGFREFQISPSDTGLDVFRRSFEVGVALLLEEVLPALKLGIALKGREQDSSQRHNYRHVDALDGHIKWNWSSRQVVDFVRAADYRPFASPTYTPFCSLGTGLQIRVLQAEERQQTGPPGKVLSVTRSGPIIACGSGAVLIAEAATASDTVNFPHWKSLLQGASAD